MNNTAEYEKYLEFSMSQHGRLREAVPALHQINHIKHCQKGQGDVDISARARTLPVNHIIVVGCRCGVIIGTERYGGGGAEDGHPTDSAPGQRGEATIHEEGQEEALPVGLSAQGGGQGLLGGLLL